MTGALRGAQLLQSAICRPEQSYEACSVSYRVFVYV